MYKETNGTVSVNRSCGYPSRIAEIKLDESYRYAYADNPMTNMIFLWNLLDFEFNLNSLSFNLIQESVESYHNPDLFYIFHLNDYNGIVHSLNTLLAPLGYNLGYS